MDDILKRAVVTLREGKYSEKLAIGKIDTTHFFMKRVGWSDGQVAVEPKAITDEDIKSGWVYHIGQLLGHALYKPVWDWLRGMGEIDGLEVSNELQ